MRGSSSLYKRPQYVEKDLEQGTLDPREVEYKLLLKAHFPIV
jgi:hypothetical protein